MPRRRIQALNDRFGSKDDERRSPSRDKDSSRSKRRQARRKLRAKRQESRGKRQTDRQDNKGRVRKPPVKTDAPRPQPGRKPPVKGDVRRRPPGRKPPVKGESRDNKLRTGEASGEFKLSDAAVTAQSKRNPGSLPPEYQDRLAQMQQRIDELGGAQRGGGQGDPGTAGIGVPPQIQPQPGPAVSPDPRGRPGIDGGPIQAPPQTEPQPVFQPPQIQPQPIQIGPNGEIVGGQAQPQPISLPPQIQPQPGPIVQPGIMPGGVPPSIAPGPGLIGPPQQAGIGVPGQLPPQAIGGQVETPGYGFTPQPQPGIFPGGGLGSPTDQLFQQPQPAPGLYQGRLPQPTTQRPTVLPDGSLGYR
jgi:hypothetical protein